MTGLACHLATWREEYPNPKFPTLVKFAQAAKTLNHSSTRFRIFLIENFLYPLWLIFFLRELRVLRGESSSLVPSATSASFTVNPEEPLLSYRHGQV